MRLETKQAVMIAELLTDGELSNLMSEMYRNDVHQALDRIRGLMRLAYLKGRRDLELEAGDIMSELIENSKEVI
jgi:hypothetical protein